MPGYRLADQPWRIMSIELHSIVPVNVVEIAV